MGKREALRVAGQSHELDECENKSKNGDENENGDKNENEETVSMCAPVHETDSCPMLRHGVCRNDEEDGHALAPEKPDRVWPIKFYLPPDLVGLWEKTIRTVRRLYGESWSLAECLEILVESFLRNYENEDQKKEHAVIERDGWRCTVPGCGSRWNLHVHHITFRSQGGTDEPENETTVCISCHQRAIHKGYIRVTGSAPGDLVWEMGVSPIHPQIARYVNGLRVAA